VGEQLCFSQISFSSIPLLSTIQITKESNRGGTTHKTQTSVRPDLMTIYGKSYDYRAIDISITRNSHRLLRNV